MSPIFNHISIYGLLISLAILAALLLADKLVKLRGLNEDVLWGSFTWVLLGGLVSARLFHVIHMFPYYAAHPMQILFVWKGGMGIIGGLIGGGLAGMIYLRKTGENVKDWLDLAAVVVPLGQSIGRWGNYFNQEIYGSPTALPWGIYIDPSKRPAGMESFERFHPLFLYESVLDLGLFLLLLRLYKRNKKTQGSIFRLYLIGYGTIRFLLEFLRNDPGSVWWFDGVNVVQMICFIVVVTVSIKHYRLNKTLQ